jgi:hypothetical protein
MSAASQAQRFFGTALTLVTSAVQSRKGFAMLGNPGDDRLPL